MERRRFNTLLGAAGLRVTTAGVTTSANLSPQSKVGVNPEVLRLKNNGWVPNNERLPVLLYRSAMVAGDSDPASPFEALFPKMGCPPQWRAGVSDFITTIRLRTRCLA